MKSEPVEHYVSDAVRLDFDVEDEDQDITGTTIEFKLYRPDGSLLSHKTTADGVIITGSRSYSVDLSGGDSQAFPEGQFRYTVHITAPTPLMSLRALGPWAVKQPRLT